MSYEKFAADLTSSGSVRFHCAVSSPGTEAESQSHPLPRRPGTEPPLARAGHTSHARERHQVHLQRISPHIRRAPCRNVTWAQRLKRVINIDIEVCGRCGGSVRVIACIEDQDIIDRILAHLRDREQDIPTLPLPTPPTRAPPETLPLFAGKDSSPTALRQQGSQ